MNAAKRLNVAFNADELALFNKLNASKTRRFSQFVKEAFYDRIDHLLSKQQVEVPPLEVR